MFSINSCGFCREALEDFLEALTSEKNDLHNVD